MGAEWMVLVSQLISNTHLNSKYAFAGHESVPEFD